MLHHLNRPRQQEADTVVLDVDVVVSANPCKPMPPCFFEQDADGLDYLRNLAQAKIATDAIHVELGFDSFRLRCE